MKFLIVLPVVNEETTDGCIASIAEEYREHMMIVDNSEDGFAKKYPIEHYVGFGENIGVSRAWNIGAKKVVSERWDYLIIMSATMRFGNGMRDFIKHLEASVNPVGLETQHGWHLIALGREIFEKIGYFDENFYPAYYEDSDFIRRMELAGIHNPMSTTARIPKIDINAGFAGNAHGMKKANIKVNMGACLKYFKDKWGTEPRYTSQYERDLMYKYPFNNPKNKLDYWEARSIADLKDLYELNEDASV